MKRVYRLYIDGKAQPDYASFTPDALKKATETNAEHWPGYEWRREDRPAATPFTVITLQGTVVHFLSHAHRDKFLTMGGINEYRRRCAEFIRTKTPPVGGGKMRRAA